MLKSLMKNTIPILNTCAFILEDSLNEADLEIVEENLWDVEAFLENALQNISKCKELVKN